MNQNLSEGGVFHFGLSHIPKALYNEKALFVLFVTNLLIMAFVFLGSTLGDSGHPLLAMPVFLAVLLLSPAGASIAGLLLMDQACGKTPRPLSKAISDGIPAFLNIFGIVLLGIALMLVFAILIGLLLFICKLPVIGPVLYAVLLPVFLILGGLLYFGLMAGLSMASPAVWSGATFRETLNLLWQIVTKRASELLVNLLLLAALVAVTQFILASIAFASGLFVTALSTSILNISPLMGSSVMEPSGYESATTFGLMTALTLVMAALTSMILMGLNLVYLRITKDLPSPKAPTYASPILTPQKSVTDRKEPTVQPTPQATATSGNNTGTPDILESILAETAPETTVGENAKMASICPLCQASIQPGDRFCGECGGNIQG